MDNKKENLEYSGGEFGTPLLKNDVEGIKCDLVKCALNGDGVCVARNTVKCIEISETLIDTSLSVKVRRDLSCSAPQPMDEGEL